MSDQKITLLATNSAYTLFSNNKEIFLVDSTTTEIIKSMQFETKIGCLQYATGIIAVCQQSQILIYDMLYDKELYIYNVYQTVLKIYLIKNILIIISAQRITIHDVDKKQNLCYLSIFSGQNVFIHPNYYQLKFFYSQNEQKLVNRSIWNNKLQVYRGIKYNYGCYLDEGNSICLAYDNIVSVYHNQKLVNLCVFENSISRVRIYNNDLFATANNMHFKIIRNKQQRQLQPGTQNKRIRLDFKQNFIDKIQTLSASINSEIWFTKQFIYAREGKQVKCISYEDIPLQNSSDKTQSQINLENIQIMSKVQEEQLPIDNSFEQLNQHPHSQIYEQDSPQKKQQCLNPQKQNNNLLNFWVSRTSIKEQQKPQSQSQQNVLDNLNEKTDQ